MRIITQKNRLFRKKKQTKASTKNATTLLGNSEAGKQSNVPPVSMLAPSASIICSTLHFSRRLSSSSHYFCNNKNGKQLQRSIMSKAPAKDDNNETRPPRKARSAYNLFFRDEQAKLRATKGRKGRRRRGASGGNDADNRVRIVADKWNNADDATKAYYFELASEDKTKYALEFAQWKQKQEEALSAHWDSKRPPSNRGTAKGNVAGNSMPVQDVPMQLPPAPHQVATTAHSESSFGFPTWQQGFHAGDELSSSSSQASAPEAGVFGSAAPKMPSDPSLRLQAQATSTIVNQGHLMTFHMQAASNDRFLPLHPETTASPDNDFLTDPQHLEELAKTLGKEGVDLMIRVFGNGEV